MSAHESTHALILGGTEGLGLAIARQLKSEGCTRLVITGRNTVKGSAAAAELEAQFMSVDLADTVATVEVIDRAADAMGRVDAMVVAGALTDPGSILDTTPDLWDRMMTANARTPFFAIQTVAQRAIAAGHGASIVNCGWMDTPGEDAVQRGHHGAGDDWLALAEAAQPFGMIVKPAHVAGLAS